MTTDPTARPASTPAPVAVPEGEPDWLTRLPDQWEDEADQHTRDQEFGIAEGLRVAADELTRAIRENARPEPVVASLPSEAVEALVRTYNEHGPGSAVWRNRDDGVADWHCGADGCEWSEQRNSMNWGRHVAEKFAALPHLRLVAEDDEDTVRVPRVALIELNAAVMDRKRDLVDAIEEFNDEVRS